MANTLITIDGIEAHAETQASVAYLASGLLGTVTTRGLRYSDDLRKEADGCGASPIGPTAASGRRSPEASFTDRRPAAVSAGARLRRRSGRCR